MKASWSPTIKNKEESKEGASKEPKLSRKQEEANKNFQNKVLSWVKEKHNLCRTNRQNFERQWYINLAFYLGKQNVELFNINGTQSVSTGIRLHVRSVPYWRSRPVINLIKPAIRNELAKLTAQKPTAVIVPATSEERDLYAAQAGEQLWESVYRDKKIKEKFREAMLWSLTTGNGFIKTYWDPNKANKSKIPGDFCYESITPFHLFFPDMLCRDIEDQPFVIHISTRTVEWCRINYPNLKVEPNVMEASDILNDSFLNLVGATDFQRNSVLCYEVWVKPGHVEFMPEGGMFTIVGDNLVQFVKSLPYEHMQYPYTHIPHIPAARFYGESSITDLIPVQREYNRTRGQISESKNRMAHPQLIAAEGSIDPSKITSAPGQVILHKLGYPPPQPMPLQDLPSYVVQEVDRLRMDFDDISGQHDVSKGQTPPGVTAATAISYLQEQDETMLASTFQSVEEAYEKIGYQTLCLVKQYWDIPRTVKVIGTDGQFNAMTFHGASIGDNTDIRIEAGSALPTSKAARQALVMDLMAQGFIPPEKGLEILDMGGVQRLYDQMKIDNAQAGRENLKMSAVTQEQLSAYLHTFIGTDPATNTMQLIDPLTGAALTDQAGQPTAPPLIVPVNSFDNHQVHIEVHNNFRKSQAFENLPQENKNLFEEHVNQHIMAMGIVPGQAQPTGAMMDAGNVQNGSIMPEEEETSGESSDVPA